MTPDLLPCARTVTAGNHDAALLAWQAAGMKLPEMAERVDRTSCDQPHEVTKVTT